MADWPRFIRKVDSNKQVLQSPVVNKRKDAERLLEYLKATSITLWLDDTCTIKWDGKHWEWTNMINKTYAAPYVINEKDARKMIWESRKNLRLSGGKDE